jgi:hypothetical protein
MKPIKEWTPKIYSNSKVPVWLSKIAPINIYAISFGCWVWCRGDIEDPSVRTSDQPKLTRAGRAQITRLRRHETIHFQQQLELLFVFQWILYGLFYLMGLLRYRNGAMAYRENPFEREAYNHDNEADYLKNRKRYKWLRYLWRSE